MIKMHTHGIGFIYSGPHKKEVNEYCGFVAHTLKESGHKWDFTIKVKIFLFNFCNEFNTEKGEVNF